MFFFSSVELCASLLEDYIYLRQVLQERHGATQLSEQFVCLFTITVGDNYSSKPTRQARQACRLHAVGVTQRSKDI